MINFIKIRQVNFFCEFKRCYFAYISHTFNSIIIKRIRYYALDKDILRFDSFLIAFLNMIINYLRFK
jgi:hypothetical protein